MIKKFLAVSASAVMMLAMSVSAFAAGSISADEQKILDELKAKNVPAEYISEAEKYLTTDGVDVTAAQATEIIADIDDAAAEAQKAGITTVAQLKNNTAVANAIAAKAQAAAKVINVTLAVDTKTGAVSATDSTGKVIFTKAGSAAGTSTGTGKSSNNNASTLQRTGADSTATVAVVSVLGLAVATLAVATKKNAEA